MAGVLLGVAGTVVVVFWGIACWLAWLKAADAVTPERGGILPGALLAVVFFAVWLVGSFVLFGLAGLLL